MKMNMVPFNIDLLLPGRRDVAVMDEITVLDIFEPSTKNFHDDGLFSVTTFGKIGSPERMVRFGYIDLKTPLLHPIIYKILTSMDGMYQGVISGKRYVVYNEETRVLEDSNVLDGHTGISYLIKHLPLIKHPDKEGGRKIYVDTLIKYKDSGVYSKLLVLPAGLRDYITDSSGKAQEDELNGLYRRVISNVSLLSRTTKDIDNDILYSVQRSINEVYLYIENILKGRNGFIESKFSGRRIFNGTRNVMTSIPNNMTSIDDDTVPGFNDTIVGLYQYLKATLPLSIHDVRTKIIDKVFLDEEGSAMLVNSKTMKFEQVRLDNKLRTSWTSSAGLGGIIDTYGQSSIRHTPVKIGDHYLGMMWVGVDDTYMFITNEDDVPTTIEAKSYAPITYTEMFYISVYETSLRVPGLVTRYPVVALGGIYPGKTYLKSTADSLYLRRRISDTEVADIAAKEYPVLDSATINSMSPHNSKLARLYADFDGDVGSLNALYTDDAMNEIDKKLSSKSFYLAPDGKLTYSAETDTINYVLASITGGI